MAGVHRRFGPHALASTFLFTALLALHPYLPVASACRGAFKVLNNLGIAPITAALSIEDKLYLLDRRDFNNSQLILPDGTRGHAVEYNLRTNEIRSTPAASNTWCSAGSYLPDGSIINTAGNSDGVRAVRLLRPCSAVGPKVPFLNAPCNTWWENRTALYLNKTRWYPSTVALPTGNIFIIGGSSGGTSPSDIIPSWEIIRPYNVRMGKAVFMQFLLDSVPNYLYPFLFLLPSDYLFIFANTKGIIFDRRKNLVVANVPEIPDKISRSFPSTGAAALLPLAPPYIKAEILICGGSIVGASKRSVATRSCFRINVSKDRIATGLTWQGRELLQVPRLLPDMLFLLDGTVAIINGVQMGYAGFNSTSIPVYAPELYLPSAPYGTRLRSDLCPSTVARGYHSTALLVRDGRVIISGSNGWGKYSFNAGPLSSEFRIEEWRPPYFFTVGPRPQIITFQKSVKHASTLVVVVYFSGPALQQTDVSVALIAPAFNTHSQSFNMRYLRLSITQFSVASQKLYRIGARAPPNTVIAVRGFYMMSVLISGQPSEARWVQLA